MRMVLVVRHRVDSSIQPPHQLQHVLIEVGVVEVVAMNDRSAVGDVGVVITLWPRQSHPQSCQPQPYPPKKPTPNPIPNPIPAPARKIPGTGTSLDMRRLDHRT